MKTLKTYDFPGSYFVRTRYHVFIGSFRPPEPKQPRQSRPDKTKQSNWWDAKGGFTDPTLEGPLKYLEGVRHLLLARVAPDVF